MFHVLLIKIAMTCNVGRSEHNCIIVFSVQTMKLSHLIRDSLSTLRWLQRETHSSSALTVTVLKVNLETLGGPADGPGGSSPTETILFFCHGTSSL